MIAVLFVVLASGAPALAHETQVARPPTRAALCAGLLDTLGRAPARSILRDVREVRHLLSSVYPPRRELDPSFMEADVDLGLDDVLSSTRNKDQHARAVVRLRAIERALTAPDAELSSLTTELRDAEIESTLARVVARTERLDAGVHGRASLVQARLVWAEILSAVLSLTPAASVAAAADPVTTAVVAAIFAPTYLSMRTFARGEITGRLLVPGWSRHVQAIATFLREGGLAFAMVSGSIAVRLPVLHRMTTEDANVVDADFARELRATMKEQLSFTPGPALERARVFFDSVFYTDPEHGHARWMVMARAVRQLTREEALADSRALRRGVALTPVVESVGRTHPADRRPID